MKKLLLTIAAVAAASASLAANCFCDVLAARLTVDDKNTVTAVEVFAVDTADLER